MADTGDIMDVVDGMDGEYGMDIEIEPPRTTATFHEIHQLTRKHDEGDYLSRGTNAFRLFGVLYLLNEYKYYVSSPISNISFDEIHSYSFVWQIKDDYASAAAVSAASASTTNGVLHGSDRLKNSLIKCIKDEMSTFVIIPLKLKLMESNNHANYIIINKANRQIFRIEPHGYFKTRSSYQPKKLDFELNKFLIEDLIDDRSKILEDYTYIDHNRDNKETYKGVNPQRLQIVDKKLMREKAEEEKEYFPDITWGLCMTWSIVLVEEILQYGLYIDEIAAEARAQQEARAVEIYKFQHAGKEPSAEEVAAHLSASFHRSHKSTASEDFFADFTTHFLAIKENTTGTHESRSDFYSLGIDLNQKITDVGIFIYEQFMTIYPDIRKGPQTRMHKGDTEKYLKSFKKKTPDQNRYDAIGKMYDEYSKYRGTDKETPTPLFTIHGFNFPVVMRGGVIKKLKSSKITKRKKRTKPKRKKSKKNKKIKRWTKNKKIKSIKKK